jgi:hypothetical protein
MLPLLLVALLLGACAVRPGPRTESLTPEVVISPSIDAYAVETSQDGQTWAALGESQSGSWVRIKRALPPVPPDPQPAGTRFVDPTLPASCTTYDAATRTCGAGAATAYPTWQSAAAVANPGETWRLRGGTYNLKARESITLARSGTETDPIVWEGYEGEAVVVKGPYDTDSHTGATCAAGNGIRDWDEDCTADGQQHADGPADSGDRAILVQLTGNWQVVRRVRIGWGFKCLSSPGAHNLIEEVVVSDCWDGSMGGTVGADNTFRYLAAMRDRHRGGPGTGAGAMRPVYYRTLSFGHGHHCTTADCTQRARTRSVGGDDSNGDTPGGLGGNNSDSYGSSKSCADEAEPGSNLCVGATWQENIGWGAVDGGFDHSEQDMYHVGNIAVDFNRNGGPGLKILRASTGNTFSGNLWLRGANNARGSEYRTKDTMRVVHNLALRNVQHGFIAAESGGANELKNNVGYLSNVEFHSFGDTWTKATNWDGDKQGDPGLTNDNVDPAPALAAAEACVDQAPHAVTVRSCWQTVWNALTAPLRPKAGSPLIDAGTRIDGVHCPQADDAGESPTSACRHWLGAAPDIGPFEFGYTGNAGSDQPDMTRCRDVKTC